MKIVYLAIIGMMAAPCAAMRLDEVDEAAAQDPQANVIVRVAAESEDGQPVESVHVIKVAGAVAADGEGEAVVQWVGEAPEGAKHKFKVLSRVAAAEVDENRGWLGVALGEFVRETDDGQQQTTETGVSVLNVVRNSPAEIAGLQKDDVITAINSEPVEGVADLARAIGEFAPGSTVLMDIVRNGQPMSLTAVLSSPQKGEIEWMHAPDLRYKDYMRTAPKILKLSPQGNMKFFSIDDLEELEDLPEGLADAMGQIGATVELSINDDERNLHLKMNRDGQVIDIQQEGDGPITVKRHSEGQDDITEAVYDSAEQLESGDPEAFELYDSHQGAAMFIDDEGNQVVIGKVHNWFSADSPSRVQIEIDEARTQFEEARRAVEDAFSDSMKTKLHDHLLTLHGLKPTRTFRVNPEGQIEMVLRKGDTEIVKVYHDEVDMQARDPEAYDRYREVMDAAEALE